MQLIQKSQHLIMPWKNQLGTTSQIDIFPRTADFSKEDFLWRLSSAEIIADNTFSIFNNYDRILTLLGPGDLQLNEMCLKENVIYKFHGEQPTSCQLLGSIPIRDLGLIYHRDQIKADMNIENLVCGTTKYLTKAQMTYAFCAAGMIKIGNFQLKEMDCLSISGAIDLELEIQTPVSKIIWLEIFAKVP